MRFRAVDLRVAAVAAALLLAGVAAAQPGSPPPRITPAAAAQIRALQLDKSTWTAAEKKLGSDLLFALKRRQGDAVLSQVPELRTGLELSARSSSRWKSWARWTRCSRSPSSRSARCSAPFPEYSLLHARVPLDRILELAERSDVRRIRRALGFELRKDNTSEGDSAHRADLARSILGVDGTGVTIGVLSDGVDSLAARQATGDLPTVNVISGQAGSGDEGTAMLEIVHDLAPGATLWFASAFGSAAQFATNISALAAAGCDVIVDDVFYFSEATFQDDVIAQAVNDFTGDGGLYFSSAGNSGNFDDGTSGVWEGDFSSAASIPRRSPATTPTTSAPAAPT